jgi:factor associated with neutral sphingomyelinase activation
LTYDVNVDVTNMQDAVSKNAIEIQVNEYGQAPKQLFKSPHPKRFSANNVEDIQKESFKEKEEVHEEYSDEIRKEISSVIINANYNFNREYKSIPKFHKKYKEINIRGITSSIFQNETNTLITGSIDGTIKLYDYKNNKVKRMFSISSFPITTMTFLNNSNIIAV